MKLIDSLDDYAEQMVDGSCYVSDGTEIKEDWLTFRKLNGENGIFLVLFVLKVTIVVILLI